MMAVNKIVSVKSAIEGHHVYRVCYSVGTKLDCFLEPENEHSDCAIIVKKGETTVGHIPEGLCQPLTQLFKDGSIVQITSEIIRGPRSAAEGTLFCSRWTRNSVYLSFIWTSREKRLVRSARKQQIQKLTA